MTPREQIKKELLVALAQIATLKPDWRLGQTLSNLAMIAGKMDAGAVWNLEDEELLAAARTLIEQNQPVESVA